MASVIEELRWKKFPVLDDGHVCLIDVMGDDAAIVGAARVSYGKGTRHTSGNRSLIRYLMRKRHTSVFEMAEVKLQIRIPMDHWRQYIRHRTASVNEYSTRYSEAIDSMQATDPDQWRLQASSNKQGSDGTLIEWPESWRTDNPEEMHPPQHPINTKWSNCKTPGQYLSAMEEQFHEAARNLYRERLDAGVAREQARKDLPLSTYTEAVWKIDLHNLLHFLGLRMDSHAQQEIREYATIIGEQIVAPLFPLTWEAFQDYRLGGLFLTRLDQEVIQRTRYPMYHDGSREEQLPYVCRAWELVTGEPADKRSRERDECVAKLEKLGLLWPAD